MIQSLLSFQDHQNVFLLPRIYVCVHTETKGTTFQYVGGSMKVKVTPSCLNLCNPKDYTVHGILQARILEWVAFPFSRGSSQPRD